jgi:hypothetical protein
MTALMKEHDFFHLPADDPSKENDMANGDSDEFVNISYTEGLVNKPNVYRLTKRFERH